ncbi:MAG TPA: response regulator [Planctomycetota bacterium]
MSSPLRVLILDPDLRSIQLTRTCLSQLPGRQFAVAAFTDVESGLATLASRPPDLVLLEVQLRGENGLRLLQVMRAMQCRAPVIVLSSHGDAQTAVTALRAGAADYVAKNDLTPARLERAVNLALNKISLERRLADHRKRLGARHRSLQLRHDELRASIDVLSRDLADSFASLQTFLAAFEGETALTDEQRTRLHEALEGCLGLRRLVGDLGSSLTGEDELRQAAAVAIDVQSLLQDVLGPLAAEANDRKITIDAAVTAAIPPVAAPPLLVDGLRNVVRRAIEGTPSNGVVRLRASEDAGAITLHVDDGAADRTDEQVVLLLSRLPAGRSRASIDLWKEGLPLRTTRAQLQHFGGDLRLESRGGSLRSVVLLPAAR